MLESSQWTPTRSSPVSHPPAGSQIARVLIIDSQPIVRQGLRRIIEGEQDLMVCGEADCALDARGTIKDSHPDAIIIDISLKQGDGIDLVRGVRAHYPSLPILVLSGYDEAMYAERMLSVGANGYLTKLAPAEQILVSLRRVIGGGIYVSETVGHNMIRRAAARGRAASADPMDRLSVRELQVLQLVGKGMSTRETAQLLNLSVKTVESHRQRIRNKLNLRTGSQFVQFAINWFRGENIVARATD